MGVVVLERRLCAVAVVDVEIDHRHSRHSFGLSDPRRDGDGGEQAEPYGTVRFRRGGQAGASAAKARSISPRATACTASIAAPAANRAARRRRATGRCRRPAGSPRLGRGRLEQSGDIGGRMHYLHPRLGRGRRPSIMGQAGVVQSVQHSLQPPGTFRWPVPGVWDSMDGWVKIGTDIGTTIRLTFALVAGDARDVML